VRRPIIVLGGAVGVVLVTAVACTFPAIGFAPDEQFTPDGSFVPPDSPTGSEGSVPGIPEGGNPDGNPCTGNDQACDCDNDGDKSEACGGEDCDDRDPRVRSTQVDFVDAASNRAGDWNCNDVVEPLEEAKLDCAKILDGGSRTPPEVEAACARQGFFDEPVCGSVGDFTICEPAPVRGGDPLKCRIKASEKRARACR
jgi:hypothetical protein